MEKEKINEIVEKWENLFPNEFKNKKNVSLACEFAANHLVENIKIKNYDSRLEYATFPVIIKIFDKDENVNLDEIEKNVINIISELNTLYVDINKKIKENNGYIDEKGVDVEAFGLKEFYDNYVLI